jgi:hypothetical protein
MRVLVTLFCLFPLVAYSQQLSLDDLYKGHHWFSLRRALASAHGPDLYVGAVASAFGRTDEAEAALHAVTGTAPHSIEAYEAHEWLAYLYMREGRYEKAVTELKDKVKARPDKESVGEDALIQALSAFPNQKIERHQPSSVPYMMEHHDLVLPLSINGHPAHFIMDSDANISALSPAQAKALGMTIKRTAAKAFGATGSGTGFDTAVADHLQIGNTLLRNVAFMVYPDDSELFKAIPVGRRGLVGLPVLRELGEMQWNPNGLKPGVMRLGYTDSHAPESPNMCFDGSDPVTEIQYKGQVLDALLDTGNEETVLWPPFARRFLPEINPSEKQSHQVAGFDGISNLDSVKLLQVDLQVAGTTVRIAPVQVLLKETTSDSNWYFGRIGIDLLGRAQQVNLNFKTMTLELR